MYYKEDWEKARENIEAFWQGEDLGRPMAIVFSPRAEECVKFPELHNGPWTGELEQAGELSEEEIARWWMDPELNWRRMKYWFEQTYFAGEAVPATYVNWGASAAAAFWGSTPEFRRTSVWYPKVINDWESWKWEFEESTNRWWKQIWEIVSFLEEHAQGNYMVGMPEFGNAADNLSLMRGMDCLAEDCLEEPERIAEAIEVMEKQWVDLHEKIYQKTKKVNQNGGVLPWMSLWAPGRIDQLACDFSSILSPEMFREVFVKDIQLMGEWTEYGMYHLDGPACMRNHLDTLLQIDCIKAIEFTPGAGQLPTLSEEYIPKYRKILEAGKRLYLLAQPDEVEPLCRQLPRKGLCLCVSVDSRKQADALIHDLYRWSHV